MGKLIFKMTILFSLVGCAQGHCRKSAHENLANATMAPDGSVVLPKNSSTWVYKVDGSLQCGMGKPVALSDMEKQLVGVKVLNSERRADGMMHIQACGTPTGQVNAYEILSTDLAKAQKLGFKELKP